MLIILAIFLLLVVGLTIYLLSQDRGAKEPVGVMWGVFGMGVAALVVAGIVESFLIPASVDEGMASLELSLLGFMGVGLIEEAAKFFPLAWFIYKKPYFKEYTDGIIYFALCGLGFGFVENVLYTLGHGTEVGILRIILVPFFHAAATGIAGFFLVRAKMQKKPMIRVLWVLGLLSAIHGLYNFGLTSGSSELVLLSAIISMLLTLGLFLFFMRANELDKSLGLSAVGNNKYCRSCGKRNKHRTLYCQFCGKMT